MVATKKASDVLSLVDVLFKVEVGESPVRNFFQSTREACHVAGTHSK